MYLPLRGVKGVGLAKSGMAQSTVVKSGVYFDAEYCFTQAWAEYTLHTSARKHVRHTLRISQKRLDTLC